MKIIENKYRDLKHICVSCGFPVMNTKLASAKCCKDIGQKKHERSHCQRVKDAQFQREARKRYKAEGRKYIHGKPMPKKVNRNDEALRDCIGWLCIDKEDKRFLSKSRFNRVCPSCKASRSQGVTVTGLVAVGRGAS